MVVATDRIGPGACVHVHVQLQVHVSITGVVMLSTSLMGGGGVNMMTCVPGA